MSMRLGGLTIATPRPEVVERFWHELVGAADTDCDGSDEVVTGADSGAAPHVKAFGARDEALMSFLAYDEGFKGGVRVGRGSDRRSVVTGSGPGARGHVKAFGANGTLLDSLFAGDPSSTKGVYVS